MSDIDDKLAKIEAERKLFQMQVDALRQEGIVILQTTDDLKEIVERLPSGQRVDCWYHDTGKTLVAVGVEGENTDYSFHVYDTIQEAVASFT